VGRLAAALVLKAVFSRMMHVAAVSGPSGSGKTTLLAGLIRSFVADGRSVGAIKHTHHPLNEENRGDTAMLLAAGAAPVILAGEGEAVIFDGGVAARRVRYDSPGELLAHFATEIVLVEGFKSFREWPQVEVGRSVEEARAILDRIWRP